MNHVKNAKERNYAFVIFLLSFIITVGIIIGAVYFNTLIPENENAILRKKIENFETQVYDQQQFIAAMEQVRTLNDSLNKLEMVHPLVERGIAEHLIAMNHPLHKEGILYGRINLDIFNLVYEYTEMNKRLLNLNKDLKDVNTLKKELEKAKGDLIILNRDLDNYRKSSNSGAGSQ